MLRDILCFKVAPTATVVNFDSCQHCQLRQITRTTAFFSFQDSSERYDCQFCQLKGNIAFFMAFLKVTLGNSDSLQEIKNFFKVALKATVVNTES